MRQLHYALFDQMRAKLTGALADLTNRVVKDLFTDISIASGEKVIIATLDSAPEREP